VGGRRDYTQPPLTITYDPPSKSSTHHT